MRVPIILFAAFIVGMSLADLAAFTRSQKRLSADECGAAAAPPSVPGPFAQQAPWLLAWQPRAAAVAG